MENEMSKSLERYYKNKDRYNARAKKYYNEIYYPLNRNKLLEKQKEKRKININPYLKKELSKSIVIISDSCLTVSFD